MSESNKESLIPDEDKTLPISSAPMRENVDEATLAPLPRQSGDLDTVSSEGETVWRAGGKIQYFGDYELIDEIARGGMGVVYRARQTTLNRIVALKMILAGQLAGEEEVRRFHAEAEAAANLDHPGIVPIYEVGEVEGQHYFSMGYVDGCSLADMIAEHPLPANQAASLMIKIADAVHYAHENGVIHRDLKPANVLVQERGARTGSTIRGDSSQSSSSPSDSVSGFSDLSPRVTDFGLAKQIQDDDQLTATGQILGTPSYMPPEQASGKVDQIDHRADVYSLGGILYALVTGRPPFQAANPLDTLMQVLEKEPVAPRQLDPNIPRDIETIALKALEKEPTKRYQSALEFSEELGRFLRGDPIKARPISAAQRAIRWSRRHRALAGLVASVVFLSIAGPLVAVRQNRLRVEANQNALRAEQLAERESSARKEAEQSRADLAAEMERGDQALYARSISLAHREWLDGNPARTRQLLAQCSPDKRGWEWQYLDSLTRAEDSAIFAHQIPAGISLSPSGNVLLTRGLQDSKLKLWDVDSGLELDSQGIRRLKNATFISDTHLLVVAGDSVVHGGVLDEEGQSKPEIFREFGAFGSTAMACRLIQDTGEVATAFQDGSVIFYNLETGDETRRMPKKRTTELSHVFSPDGELVAGLVDKRVRVWETATGEERFEVAGHVAQADVISFSPDASMVATAGRGGTVFLTDTESGRRIREIRAHQSTITSLDFSQDGNRMLTGSADLTARIFDVATGSQLLVIRGHEQAITDCAIHPDGRRVITSSLDGSVRVWTVDQQLAVAPQVREKLQGASHLGHEVGLESRVFNGQLGMVYDVKLSPDGKLAASAAVGNDQGDNQIRVWSLDNATTEAGFPVPDGLLHTLEFSADSKYLIVGSGGAGDAVAPGSVTIWDVANKQRVHVIDAGSCMFIRPVLNADNSILAVIVGNLKYGHVRFYSFPDAKLRNEQELQDQRLSGIAFSKVDNTLLTSTAPGGSIQVWDANTGDQIDQFSAHGSGVFAIDVSSDGRLATANIDGTIGIWNWKKQQLLGQLKGHNAYAVDVCFNPDGNRLLSSSEDKTVKIWDVNSFNELLTFKDHRSPALGADWSGDGKTLASTSRDGTVIVWELRRKSDPAEESEWIAVFEDDFERSTLGGQWNPTVADAWKIENGRLVGTLKPTEMPGSTFPAAFISLGGVDIPKQVEVQADVRLRQPMLVQMVLSNQRTSQYIAPFIAPTEKPYGFAGSAVQVAKGAGEETKLLNAQVGTQLTAGKVYQLKVRRQNDEIQFFLDGELLSETRIPMLETDTLTLSGCWSNLGDQLEFDNVVVRIPESLRGEAEIRAKVNGWLSQYLVPQLVEKKIRSEFPEDSNDRVVALRFLRGLNANDSFTGKDVVSAIENVVNQADATAEQYKIAAEQAEFYMTIKPDDWWLWSKFALAYARDGQFEKAIDLLDKADVRCIEQEGHRYPLALAARALTMHAMNRPESAREAHESLHDFMINQWKPTGLADLKKEVDSKVPIEPNELKDVLLKKIRTSRHAFYRQCDVEKELADFTDDAVITYGRSRRPDQHDLKYDRDQFEQLESIYCSSAPHLHMHLVWDQIQFHQRDNRIALTVVEHMKFKKPDFSTISIYRFGLGYQFEKRNDEWVITKHRIWQVDRKNEDQWERWDADHWKNLDQRITDLKQAGDALELARLCIQAGRLPEAIQAARLVHDDEQRSSAERAEALTIIGEGQIQLVRFEQGIDTLERARLTDPTVQMPWFLTRRKGGMETKQIPFSMTISPETNRMATSHNGGQIVVWDLATMKEANRFEGHLNVAADLGFFDEGRKIVSGGFDRAVNVFATETGTRIQQYGTHLNIIYRLESHPLKPEIVVTSSADRSAKVWDLSQQRELFSLAGHSGHVMTAAFSPDGKQIATGSSDKTIRIWDASRGSELKQFEAHDQGGVWRVDWTPAGDRLISVGKDNMVRLWDTKDWSEIAAFNGHEHEIEAVRVSPDGKMAASADMAGDIFVWDLETLKPLSVLRGHWEPVYDLQFYKSDLFSAGGDGAIRQWDVDFSRSPLSLSMLDASE